MVKTFFKIENIFVLVSLIWGALFLLFNPPFLAPDENAHLFKMWGYTNFSLNYKKQAGKIGQIVPVALNDMVEHYKPMRFNPNIKTNLTDVKKMQKVKLEKENSKFVEYTPTSYTPFSYFPSCIVLFLLKWFNVTPFIMVYILRFCSLLTYLALTYTAIKITPIKKYLFLVLALLPLNLYQASAISTDGITFGFAFLFVAYVLRLAFNDEIKEVTKEQFTILSCILMALCICKFTYYPFILLFFLIPKEKFNSYKQYLLNFLKMAVVNAVVVFAFCFYNMQIFSNLSNTVGKMSLSIGFFSDVITTTIHCFEPYLKNIIASYGWASSALPQIYVELFYLTIFLTIIYDDFNNKFLKIKDRIFILISVISSYVLVVLAVFVVYHKSPIIYGVQGRYLTPFLILTGLFFTSKILKTKSKILPILIISLLSILLCLSFVVMINLFY